MKTKIKLTLLAFIASYCCIAQHNDKNSHILVEKELQSFIDTVKPMSLYDGKYNVYVMNVVQGDSSSLYFSFGYIMNAYNLNYIQADFFAKIGSEIVLFQIKDSLNFQLLTHFNALKIEGDNVDVIKAKLNHEEGVFLNGVGQGEVCRIRNGIVKTKFYESASSMPKIYKYYDVDELWKDMYIKEVFSGK